jgi:RHS repeat-associated protein
VQARIERSAQGTSTPEIWRYTYDPFGRRVAKWQVDEPSQQAKPGTLTRFCWDGNRLLMEQREPAQGQPQTQSLLYLYEPETFVPLALVRSQRCPPLGTQQEIFYVHTDHLGTPQELTDEQGQLVWAAQYKAWGGIVQIERPPRLITHAAGNTVQQVWQAQAEPVQQNLRFQGQYFDAETGLHYNRLRYYDPDCGRFISQDPIGLRGGVNLYQYAPNPVAWIDPLGLSALPSCQCNLGSGPKRGRLGNQSTRQHIDDVATEMSVSCVQDCRASGGRALTGAPRRRIAADFARALWRSKARSGAVWAFLHGQQPEALVVLT